MRIAFERNDPSIFAKAIRWWTDSPYSHCELIFGETLWFSSHMASKGTRFIVQDMLNTGYWDVLEVPTTQAEEDAILAFCRSELNCGYDWWGIWFSQVLRLQREHPEKWFCSEICAAALQQVGLLPGAKPCTFSPGKLYKRLREAGATACAP